jgi:hypothetical protein
MASSKLDCTFPVFGGHLLIKLQAKKITPYSANPSKDKRFLDKFNPISHSRTIASLPLRCWKQQVVDGNFDDIG